MILHNVDIGTYRHDTSNQRQQNYRKPPKFSTIVNEYVGACLDDHCKVGKSLELEKAYLI